MTTSLDLDVLAGRVSELRREGADDLIASLLKAYDSSQDLTEALGRLLQKPVVRFQELSTWTANFEKLPFSDAASKRCTLFSSDSSQHKFLVVDPFDVDLIAWARSRFHNLHVYLASQDTFDAWLQHAESTVTALGSVQIDLTPEGGSASRIDGDSLSLQGIGSETSAAVRFVNSTVYDALKTGASDIHLECDPAGLGVKFRIDGVLGSVRRLDSTDVASQVISRVKVMAQLDIAERRVPQDGRLQVGFKGRQIDVRVSVMPSIHGEDAVLRILDREHLAQSLAGLTLAKLGFDEPSQQAIRKFCNRPHGMLLVTGPTGSGKTTTLYAAISETHQSRDKIITIEDPVEYQLPGVLQIPVNERKGLTFARGLRSILRHDPDKILVGEIRDSETAQIAVQSALTGHLVFTTVHANTVFDVVGRFEQFGIDAYTFASAINGVLAQRLLRRLCSACASPEETSTGRRWRAVGCEVCRGTGYAGRFAMGELLQLTPEIKALIAKRAPLQEVQSAAALCGWRSLREQALVALVSGATTEEEVNRVAD